MIIKKGKKRILPFHQASRTLRWMLMALFIASCSPIAPVPVEFTQTPLPVMEEPSTPTPIPTRPSYAPGTLVDYTVQSGDTLPALAAHFNTSVPEILEANSTLTKETTTLNPGEVIQIPIYFEALWGNPFQIIPDALFVNGPAQTGFDTGAYVDSMPGWLKGYSALAGEETRFGGDLVEFVALNYSVSPRLLLALAEYQSGALTSPSLAPDLETYPLGYRDMFHKGFYLQLVWAANTLNNGYYGWRSGSLDTIDRLDGTLEHPDPWQNAATVALQYYFSLETPVDGFKKAIYSEGLIKTYTELFGDPWQNVAPNIPGGLQQPAFKLPFAAGKTWTYTGGPHAAWGEGEPLAAIDFAPNTGVGGCSYTFEYAAAISDGQVVRSGQATAVLDLDMDGDERTGWVILYLHLASEGLIRPGVLVKTGDALGHPSCEGGSKVTGTHVHIARKYNGEWILADGALAFNLDGWIAGDGSEPYLGTLKKFGRTVEACTCSDPASQITAGK